MSNFELSVLFFLQMAVILTTCRVVGLVARRLGQPPVVGEMIAGLLLGPSLLGWIWPTLVSILPAPLQFELFPKSSMTILYALAQLGLTVYMFLIGVEFRADLFGARIRSAASVSIAGMAAPFVLGVGIALALHGNAGWFGGTVTPFEAALYLGAAMSITAFPMLARMVYERGLSGTSLGTLALAAGSIDDAAAWCLLAIVLASFGDDPTIAVWAIGGGALYAAVVWLGLRPLLRPLGRMVETQGSLRLSTLGGVLALVMLGAWYTDRIGIYAVFGAFVLGTAMPRGKFAEELHRLVHPLTTTLLLPLYFVYSGLNTRVGLVNTPALWGVAVLVLAAAIVGKGVACFLAARLNGEPVRESAAIGALMNTRGMMELIILNIGYERGDHLADAVLDHGPDGDRDHVDDYARVRARVRARTGRSARGVRPHDPSGLTVLRTTGDSNLTRQCATRSSGRAQLRGATPPASRRSASSSPARIVRRRSSSVDPTALRPRPGSTPDVPAAGATGAPTTRRCDSPRFRRSPRPSDRRWPETPAPRPSSRSDPRPS